MLIFHIVLLIFGDFLILNEVSEFTDIFTKHELNLLSVKIVGSVKHSNTYRQPARRIHSGEKSVTDDSNNTLIK